MTTFFIESKTRITVEGRRVWVVTGQYKNKHFEAVQAKVGSVWGWKGVDTTLADLIEDALHGCKDCVWPVDTQSSVSLVKGIDMGDI